MARLKYYHIGFVFLVLFIFGCSDSGSVSEDAIVGSNKTISIKMDMKNFSTLVASNAFQINVRRSDSFAVQLKINENLRDYLRVQALGPELSIGLDRKYNYRNTRLSAAISMPVLNEIVLRGASNADISSFNSNALMKFKLAGASSVSGSVVLTGDVQCHLSGASSIQLSGLGGNLRLNASGASILNLENFQVRTVDAHMSGASEAAVRVRNLINANLSGASMLYYIGNPRLGQIMLSGGSEVKKRIN